MSKTFEAEMAALEEKLQAAVPGAAYSIRFLPAERSPIVIDIRARRTGFLGALGFRETISTGRDQHEYASALRQAINAIPERKRPDTGRPGPGQV